MDINTLKKALLVIAVLVVGAQCKQDGGRGDGKTAGKGAGRGDGWKDGGRGGICNGKVKVGEPCVTQLGETGTCESDLLRPPGKAWGLMKCVPSTPIIETNVDPTTSQTSTTTTTSSQTSSGSPTTTTSTTTATSPTTTTSTTGATSTATSPTTTTSSTTATSPTTTTSTTTAYSPTTTTSTTTATSPTTTTSTTTATSPTTTTSSTTATSPTTTTRTTTSTSPTTTTRTTTTIFPTTTTSATTVTSPTTSTKTTEGPVTRLIDEWVGPRDDSAMHYQNNQNFTKHYEAPEGLVIKVRFDYAYIQCYPTPCETKITGEEGCPYDWITIFDDGVPVVPRCFQHRIGDDVGLHWVKCPKVPFRVTLAKKLMFGGSLNSKSEETLSYNADRRK